MVQDGSLLHAFVSKVDMARFRSRKGFISTNLLAACLFCLRFCYLLCGWEGSAADSRIFDEARRSDFAIEPGTYYLADAGFPLCDALLVPYRGVPVPFEGMGASQLTVGFILCISWLLLTFPLVSGLQITKSSSISATHLCEMP